MTLEDRLRRELQRASVALPIVGIDLDDTLSRGRRARRRTVVAAVAAASVIAVAVGGIAVLTRSTALDPRPQPPAGGSSSTATPEQSPLPTDTSPPEREPALNRVEPVLREWLQAIRGGDEDRAWSLMTPEAQDVVGRERFEEMMASALPEGLGAFADASRFQYVVVSSEDDEARVVAVVSGKVTREGTTSFATMAIPMRLRPGETLVDDHFDRSRYYDRVAVFASASLGPQPYHAGDELIVEFSRPEGASDVIIAVDDNRRPLPTEFDPATGRATATLDRDLVAGRHIATVVVLHRSGRLYPEAIVFEAAVP